MQSPEEDIAADGNAEGDEEPDVQPQCGIQNTSTEQQPTPPWALRIIGEPQRLRPICTKQDLLLASYDNT
jgi:hypothetical protein